MASVGRMADALSFLRRAAQIDPQSPMARTALALVHRPARRDLDRTVRIAHGQPLAHGVDQVRVGGAIVHGEGVGIAVQAQGAHDFGSHVAAVDGAVGGDARLPAAAGRRVARILLGADGGDAVAAEAIRPAVGRALDAILVTAEIVRLA